ncbi:MAG: STAS domain-containing protein [Verrucomicrobiae bacterium]|nr:STAS domain-containing protein [Verrucomicrobiae bacterium]
MEFKIEALAIGIDVVHLNGRLDIGGIKQIETPFAELAKNQTRPLILDLAQVSYLASVGIRLLLTQAKALSAKKVPMALCNIQPLVAETLKFSVLDLYLPIFPDIPSAQKALTQKDAGQKASG